MSVCLCLHGYFAERGQVERRFDRRSCVQLPLLMLRQQRVYRLHPRPSPALLYTRMPLCRQLHVYMLPEILHVHARKIPFAHGVRHDSHRFLVRAHSHSHSHSHKSSLHICLPSNLSLQVIVFRSLYGDMVSVFGCYENILDILVLGCAFHPSQTPLLLSRSGSFRSSPSRRVS